MICNQLVIARNCIQANHGAARSRQWDQVRDLLGSQVDLIQAGSACEWDVSSDPNRLLAEVQGLAICRPELGYILKPGALVLGITKETVTLPGNVCGWINSRSRFARIGLMSHIAAPFISPGVSNKQVLEIFNAGNHPINLVPGVKICHLVLQECKGSAMYKGKFRKQTL